LPPPSAALSGASSMADASTYAGGSGKPKLTETPAAYAVSARATLAPFTFGFNAESPGHGTNGSGKPATGESGSPKVRIHACQPSVTLPSNMNRTS